jgi:hypothetical protein
LVATIDQDDPAFGMLRVAALHLVEGWNAERLRSMRPRGWCWRRKRILHEHFQSAE